MSKFGDEYFRRLQRILAGLEPGLPRCKACGEQIITGMGISPDDGLTPEYCYLCDRDRPRVKLSDLETRWMKHRNGLRRAQAWISGTQISWIGQNPFLFFRGGAQPPWTPHYSCRPAAEKQKGGGGGSARFYTQVTPDGGSNRLYAEGGLGFHGQLQPLAVQPQFQGLMRAATQPGWVVYSKRPFAGPGQVLAYLSRYTHRVGISNRRLLALDRAAGTITFDYKDYADQA